MTNEVSGEGRSPDATAAGERKDKRVRVRRQWSEAIRDAFFAHLSRTCSISHSVAMVGMSRSGLDDLRRRDENFREQFAQALQLGYEQVEADLLARALAQGATVEQDDRGAVVIPPFDAELALKLLQVRDRSGRTRRPSSGATVKRATEREIEDALVAKLKGLAKRLALES